LGYFDWLNKKPEIKKNIGTLKKVVLLKKLLKKNGISIKWPKQTQNNNTPFNISIDAIR
jgi:hypothetical protein